MIGGCPVSKIDTFDCTFLLIVKQDEFYSKVNTYIQIVIRPSRRMLENNLLTLSSDYFVFFFDVLGLIVVFTVTLSIMT